MDEASDSVFGKVWATNFAPILAPGSSPEADQMWKEVARMNHAKVCLDSLSKLNPPHFFLPHYPRNHEEGPFNNTERC